MHPSFQAVFILCAVPLLKLRAHPKLVLFNVSNLNVGASLSSLSWKYGCVESHFAALCLWMSYNIAWSRDSPNVVPRLVALASHGNLLENACSQALSQTYWIKNWEWSLTICVLTAFQVILMQINVWKPLDYICNLEGKNGVRVSKWPKCWNAVEEKPVGRIGSTVPRPHGCPTCLYSSPWGFIGPNVPFQDLLLTWLPFHPVSHPFPQAWGILF